MKQLLLTTVLGLAALFSTAVAKTLTVYTAISKDASDFVEASANAAGLDVRFVTDSGGSLFDRILAERNNPQADLVFGLIDASMATLKSEGLLASYEPSWGADLPAAFRDDADNMVYKFWQTPIVLAYNADAISADEAPKSWLELIEPQYKNKYVIGSLGWQTTRSYLGGILVRFLDEEGEVTDEGWDFMREFYANAIVVDDGDAKLEAFTSGDAYIDLNWFGGAFRLADQVGYTVKLVDTVGGTPVIGDGLGILKGTDQMADAQAFVDWFGSAEFMATYAEKFGKTPNLPAALAASPAQVRENATLVSTQPIDWDAVAPKMDAWMQKIELEIR